MLWAFPNSSDIICDLKSNQDRVILIQGRCLSCHSLIWIPRLHTFCFIAIWFPRLTINYRISGNQLSVSFVYWQKGFANASRIHCCRVSYLSRSLPWQRKLEIVLFLRSHFSFVHTQSWIMKCESVNLLRSLMFNSTQKAFGCWTLKQTLLWELRRWERELQFIAHDLSFHFT